MARCPFAVWQPISGSSGPHVGGPYKIVHHTTEGSSATGALAAFAQNKSDPHFTVDATRILQHIDTAEGARALRTQRGTDRAVTTAIAMCRRTRIGTPATRPAN